MGQLLNFTPASGGSKSLQLTLRTAPDGTVTGTLVFGGGPLLPPATDPNVGYPPGIADGGIFDLVAVAYWSFEHFPFTLLDGSLDGSRLSFAVDMSELWARWCALQTTIYPLSPAMWVDAGDASEFGTSCPPGGVAYLGAGLCPGSDPQPGLVQQVDCAKLTLCHRCACTLARCWVRAAVQAESLLHFDLQLAGSRADGSVLGLGVYERISEDFVLVHFDKLSGTEVPSP
jgi:hypothetical protein